MMIAGVGILAATAGVLLAMRGPRGMIGGEREAKADAGANVEADASAGANVEADASAGTNVDARAETNAEAADAGANANVEAHGHAAARDASTSTSGGMETAGTDDAGGGRVVNLDEGSDGKTIELAKGQAIVLMLSARPTSGFDWAVLKAPAALGSPGMGFVAGGDQTGAVGKRRIAWILKEALPAGDHAVELGYQRSFEQGIAPFKTFRFKVRAAR
jgi:predicted secreted protein